MTKRNTLYERLEGRHVQKPSELLEMVEKALSREANIPIDSTLQFENAGDIRTYYDSAESHVVILVPLPHLVAADVETDELRTALAPVAPAGISIEVDIAQPPSTNP